MNFKTLLLLIALLGSAVAAAEACEPRSKKQVRVEGALTAVQQNQIDISTSRRTETLLITGRTRITHGGMEIDATALRPGDQIVAQGVRLRSGQLEAREIRTGDQTGSTPSTAGPAAGGHKH